MADCPSRWPLVLGSLEHALTKLGYSDVRKYREGIQDWVEAGLPVQSGSAAA